jgi:CRP/FNR family transcriptional regulator, cyclic AMP receptor protein
MKISASTHPFFAGMSKAHLAILSEASMFAEFTPGEVIIREGEAANRFYLIHTGEVELAADVPGRGLMPFQTLGPGSVLGWSWLFPPHTWRFDARAVTHITATFFYGTGLRERCETNPVFGYELMKRVSKVTLERLQTARDQMLALYSDSKDRKSK